MNAKLTNSANTDLKQVYICALFVVCSAINSGCNTVKFPHLNLAVILN